MSTLRVDNIQSYAGGDVTLDGNLDVTGIISGDGSGLTNVPGGGSDLSSYTGSINQTGGNTTLNGDFNVSANGGAQTLFFNGGGLGVYGSQINAGGGINLPYDGSIQNINVGLSGSLNYNIGGFDFDGKTYGQIYSQADGGFQIVDAAAAGTNSNVTIQSDNASINLRTNNTGSNAGYILNQIAGNSLWRAQQSNYKLTLFGAGIGVSPTAGYTGSAFAGNIDATYGLNLYDSVNFNQDTGLTLNLNGAAGTGTNKIGIFSNFGGAGYQDIISWEDANNYTDGALQVHQILKVDGSNNAPGATLDVKDGTGTPKLQVQNAALKALTGVDVVINGDAQIANGLTLPGLGDYADDAAAATGGVPLNGVYRTGNVLKIRIV